MKLKKLYIQNFRKLNKVEINLAEATFLVGANNSGKSSALDAIEFLISDKSKLDNSCRSRYIEDGEEKVNDTEDIIIEGTFTNVPRAIVQQRGFNASRLTIEGEGADASYSFKYRVRYDEAQKTHREMLMHTITLKQEYKDCTTYQEFIDRGIGPACFEGQDLHKRITTTAKKELENLCPEAFEVGDAEEWFDNPGGIPGNVLSRLPRFLKIKADVLSGEMAADKSGTLHDLLDILFSEVREASPNYKKAKEALFELEKEMDTTNPDTEFGKLMAELNMVVDGVFHKASINVETELTKPENLKAKFSASLTSNVKTPIEYQGTGLIRATVFALLRYNKQREEQAANGQSRGIIIGFEEPELFLHPNAAEKMRDVIYELATADGQIVATTHSPYMVDISKCNTQVINSFKVDEHEFASVRAFNLSDAFKAIVEDDCTRIKMVQKIDDYVARVFFAQKVIIVEGDTEDIVFRHTINAMPEEVRKAIKGEYQIVKATGKATMISLIKYLKALGISPFVVHDEDAGTEGAERMNAPILSALEGEEAKRLMMHNCIEDELGYPVSASDKPYKAYLKVRDWYTWDDVPDNWKSKMRIVFSEFADSL